MKTRCSTRIALSLMLVLACVVAMAQVSPPTPGASPTEGQKLVAQGNYSEGLAALDQELKADPQNTGLQLAKVDALMGLKRYRDAAPIALKLGSTSPEAKYKAALCALAMGFPANAAQMWGGLFGDVRWGAKAYEGAVQALLAQGREGDAKALVERALASLHPPSYELLRLAMMLRVKGAPMQAALQASAKGDPSCAELLALWTAAGGNMFEEAPPKAEPLVLAVKERSEEVQQSTLQWGGGTYSPQAAAPAGSTAVSSSSQGYGAGMRSTADTEGGKTGTSSNLRRVVLNVSIDGSKDEPMVFSSQGDTVFVTAAKAKSLNLSPVARSSYRGPGAPASTPCDVVLLKEFGVGGLVFKNVPAKVIDPRTDYWKTTAGIVPLWLFRHYALMYDRRGGKLTLYPPGTKPEALMGEGSFTLKTQWASGAPYVAADVQGRPDTFLMLELSLPSTYLSQDALPLLGLTVNIPRYGHRQEVGPFGWYSYGVAERATFGLGPAKIDLAAVRAAEAGTGLSDWSFGALGRETTDLFQIFVDYSSDVVAFKGYGK